MKSALRFFLSRSLFAAVAVATLSACGDEPPALRVGSLGFTPEEARSIPGYSHPELADVAGWGLAVSDGRVDTLLAPLARRAAEQARLAVFPYFLGAEQMGLSEDDLPAAYAASPEWELEVRHIIRLAEEGGPAEQREQAREEAEEVLRRARSGEDFAALAAELSEEPGAAERGGLLQPGREGTWVEPFWEAAVGLQPGEISGVVETRYGYHVLKLEDRTPVPYGEADRAALLRRAVPAPTAFAAMERWAAGAPRVALDPADAASAKEMVLTGELPLDSAIFAAGESAYRGEQLAAAWASTTAEERQDLTTEGSGEFEGWLQEQVREALWASEAERLGAPAPREAASGALSELRGTAARWTAILGFAPGMDAGALRSAAIQGVAARGQEFRIARQELEALRPILRWHYPLVVPGAADPS